MSRAGKLQSGRAEIAFEIEGDESKPLLLLSNSLAADRRMWESQRAALSQSHRLLRYDSRGHGASSAPEGPYSFDELVGDMVALLDHVGVERADVLGLSLGGMTALGLAITRPERVNRLVVCDARADNPPPFVASWDERIAAIKAGGMEAIAAGTLARWFTEGAPQAAVDLAREMIVTTPVRGYIGAARALQTLNWLKDLPMIPVPVLYVVGGEDLAAPVAVMEAMAAATPQGEIVVLEGLGHLPNMQDPAAFNSVVAGWLAR